LIHSEKTQYFVKGYQKHHTHM